MRSVHEPLDLGSTPYEPPIFLLSRLQMNAQESDGHERFHLPTPWNAHRAFGEISNCRFRWMLELYRRFDVHGEREALQWVTQHLHKTTWVNGNNTMNEAVSRNHLRVLYGEGPRCAMS